MCILEASRWTIRGFGITLFCVLASETLPGSYVAGKPPDLWGTEFLTVCNKFHLRCSFCVYWLFQGTHGIMNMEVLQRHLSQVDELVISSGKLLLASQRDHIANLTEQLTCKQLCFSILMTFFLSASVYSRSLHSLLKAGTDGGRYLHLLLLKRFRKFPLVQSWPAEKQTHSQRIKSGHNVVIFLLRTKNLFQKPSESRLPTRCPITLSALMTFSTSNNRFLHNDHVIIKIRKLTLIHYHHEIHRCRSSLAKCPNKALQGKASRSEAHVSLTDMSFSLKFRMYPPLVFLISSTIFLQLCQVLLHDKAS